MNIQNFAYWLQGSLDLNPSFLDKGFSEKQVQIIKNKLYGVSKDNLSPSESALYNIFLGDDSQISEGEINEIQVKRLQEILKSMLDTHYFLINEFDPDEFDPKNLERQLRVLESIHRS